MRTHPREQQEALCWVDPSASRADPSAPPPGSWCRCSRCLVLLGSGYGWVQLQHLEGGLTRVNVIDPVSGAAGVGRTSGPVSAAPATSPDAEVTPRAVPEQNILLVGIDSRTDAEGSPLPQALLDQLHAGGSGDGGDSTDTMIVLHIPAGAARATAISIPRDSYVRLADGWGQHKINSAYAYGQHSAQASTGSEQLSGPQRQQAAARAGARTVISTVEALTGLSITHYAAINLVGFYRISEAVGGVRVCLNGPAHDDYSGVDLPAGWQSLQGAQALAFVRQRHGLPRGDLDRIRRQQVFLAALTHQVLAVGTLADPVALNHLVAALRSSVTVDEGLDLLTIARQLRHLSAGEITFVTIPTGNPALPTPTDGQAVQVDPDQVHTFIHALLTEAKPPTPPQAYPSPSDAPNRAESVGPDDSAPSDHLAQPPVPVTSTALTCMN